MLNRSSVTRKRATGVGSAAHQARQVAPKSCRPLVAFTLAKGTVMRTLSPSTLATGVGASWLARTSCWTSRRAAGLGAGPGAAST